MISARDLRDRVAEWQLRDNVVEKDYVLGWVLAGIGSEPGLRDGWVFKGGTCLKKCYIETFRFSEDLDFTVVGGPIEEDDIRAYLDPMLERIGRESGIDFAVGDPRFRARPNGSVEGRIYYRGPRSDPSAASIRLDLTRNEVLARPTVVRPIQHLYPDTLPAPGTVRCYSLEELYAEKIRAMGERGRPRDLYDIIFLLDFPDLADHGMLIQELLIAKCRSKGVPIPTLDSLEASPSRGELVSEWENMLGHQLPVLPPFEHYWSRLHELFDWLDGLELARLEPVTGGAGESVWSPSPVGWAWGAGVALEPIRFAGANRLCVDLGYQGSVRRIEPYSLRVTRDGNLLLYAIRRQSRELRSYRVDRITSVTVTTEPFQPVNIVEFRPSGPTFSPQVPARPRRSGATSRQYRVRCPYCGKTFTRKRPGPRLNVHKDRAGGRCIGSGRLGERL